MVTFLISLLVVVLVLLPLWSLLRLSELGHANRQLARKVAELDSEMSRLRQSVLQRGVPAAPRQAEPATEPPTSAAAVPPLREEPPFVAPQAPNLPISPLSPVSRRAAQPPHVAEEPAADWERFMGAKLFAWLGGLAGFLGAAFFVKYSFEHELIPPTVRVAIGFIFALGLLVGGLAIPRARYAITAQTLIATGIVSLYAVTFACNSYYHFPAFGPTTTFAIMSVITIVAFLLAVRLEARVIAVLGMLGGFLTPVLLSSGENRPLALFGYIALLDVGLLTVALRRQWLFLLPLAAAGTVFMEAAWTGKFFATDTAGTLVVICGAFFMVFLGAFFAARRLATRGSSSDEARRVIVWSAAALPLTAYVLALAFVGLPPAAGVHTMLLILVLLANASLLALAWYETPGDGSSFADRAAEWLGGVALLGTALVEHAWYARHRPLAAPGSFLGWYLVFDVVFGVYPFVWWRRFERRTAAWAVAALAGAIQFPLVYELVRHAWPDAMLGLLPAAFAIPAFVSLAVIARYSRVEARSRLNQLAWFGGIGLLFVTLIFPIQFHRQWVTLGWALEGAALLALYHRLPHRGLQAVGVLLAVIAFVRLALNPAVLEYHPRADLPVLNWYLYTYGVVVVALFAGARLTHAPRDRVFDFQVPPLLSSLAVILTFLLLNIEIADFFSAPGTRVLTFQFSGNFARDMTYTIAWALFALLLLLISIGRGVRAGRYGALGLLGIVVAKLFLHDLARLDALYRIGALFAVAVIAIIASYAYQRFLPNGPREP